MMSMPATFLTIVCVTYFLIAPYKTGGLYLPHTLSYVVGIVAGVAMFALFIYKTSKTGLASKVK